MRTQIPYRKTRATKGMLRLPRNKYARLMVHVPLLQTPSGLPPKKGKLGTQVHSEHRMLQSQSSHAVISQLIRQQISTRLTQQPLLLEKHVHAQELARLTCLNHLLHLIPPAFSLHSTVIRRCGAHSTASSDPNRQHSTKAIRRSTLRGPCLLTFESWKNTLKTTQSTTCKGLNKNDLRFKRKFIEEQDTTIVVD